MCRGEVRVETPSLFSFQRARNFSRFTKPKDASSSGLKFWPRASASAFLSAARISRASSSKVSGLDAGERSALPAQPDSKNTNAPSTQADIADDGMRMWSEYNP